MHWGTLSFGELLVRSFRISDMRFCAGLLFNAAVVLLAGSVFAQDSVPASTPTPPSFSASSAPPPIDLKSDASGVVAPEQIRELLRRAEENDVKNDKQARDYTYVEREERHHLDGHGGIKKVESRSSEILEISGEPVERLTAKDDKPLSPEEAKREDDKIQKIIDKHKKESDEGRGKRRKREEKEHEDDRKFVLEVADAFNFKLVGSEVFDGHDTWVLECEPRPGYEPKTREGQLLRKVKGRVWIDKKEESWVKLDVVAIDTISFGFVLARIHKGTHIVVEMTKVNGEVWLPKQVQAHVDLRLALFKSYDEDVEQTYRDYKKFRTDTKITVVGEESREQ